MISLNLLKTNVLITTDEVIFHAPVEGTVDPRSIMQSIIVAERRFIKPMLGATVYDALIAVKNLLVTAGNKAATQTAFDDARGTDREPYTLKEGDIVNSDDYLSTTQKTLWNNYLHKITAECVYFVALPVNRSRFNSQGVTQNNPASITSSGGPASIDLRDLKHLMDRSLQDRIDPLMEDMHQYLCKTKYPGYTKDCGCDSNGTAYKKKTDIILSMYDNDENCKCEWPD
jgi:hypothetical protein